MIIDGGNSLNAEFIGSGFGVYVDAWPRSATEDTPMLPIIMTSSGFNYPNFTENALYVARGAVYDDNNEYRGYQLNKGDLEVTNSEFDEYDTLLPITSFTGAFAYPNCSKPHSELYKCLNWWEFTNIPTDISIVPSAHVNNFNSEYGGYSNVAITAWKGMPRNDIVTKQNVTCNKIFNDNTFTTFRIETTLGMPDHMGSCMLFSADDSFDGSKLIGVGMKGLVHYHITGSNCDDVYYKLYRFSEDSGYFKSVGNKFYVFNDPNFIAVKGENYNNGPYSFCYSGPFFVNAGLSAGRYTDSNKTVEETLNIKASDYVQDKRVFTSISYLCMDNEIPVTSAKPIGSIGNYDTSTYQYRIRKWNDNSKNITYYSLAPFAPGIPIATGTNVSFVVFDNATEVEFGATLSSFSCIQKGNILKDLTAINGTWDYCYNVTYDNSINRMFISASNLVKIPSSWHGLQNLQCTDINNMFEDCHALTAIPSSFKDFGDGTKITQAYDCFRNCFALQEGLKSWEGLDSVEYADYMFQNCYSLKYIPDTFEHFGNLRSLYGMFFNCKSLTEVKSWEGLRNRIEKVYSAFALCDNLTAIPDKWFGPISGGSYMFEGCSGLKEIKSWNNIDAIYDAAEMFENCKSLSAIPSSWDGLNLKINAPYMFGYCSNLKSIPTSAEWDKLFRRLEQNNNVSDCSQNSIANFPDIFYECSALEGDANIAQVFANHKVPYCAHFRGCTKLNNYEYYRTKADTSAYF